MKRPIRTCAGLVLFLVSVATALYSQRVRIGDLIAESPAPMLPAAVEFKDTTEGAVVAEPSTTETSVDVTVSTPPAPLSGTEVPVKTDKLPKLPATTHELSATYNLAVPFTSQAPFANWDEMHEETCEEAVIYMVSEFYKGTSGKIDPTAAETELQRLVAIENDTFGYYKDTTAAETARLAKIAYGYSRVDLVEDPTADQIKALVASGHPVVIPTAGRELHNPNFSGDGPPYHMVVIRGYTETQFVTNDPGTRRGEAYVYGIDTIMNAMHDWNGGDVMGGKKVAIVIYP